MLQAVTGRSDKSLVALWVLILQLADSDRDTGKERYQGTYIDDALRLNNCQ